MRNGRFGFSTAQQRKIAHLEESYRTRGLAPKEAAARAWAEVTGPIRSRAVPRNLFGLEDAFNSLSTILH